MKTALLLEKLEGQLATLRQRCAPVSQFATLSARFDRHLFQTRATTLQACLDEAGDNLAALRHAVEQQQLPQVAWLAEHLAAQLEAIAREASAWSLREWDSAPPKIARWQRKRIQHQDFEENAPDDVKLAVDLIVLLEENQIPASTVLRALDIVKRDYEKKLTRDDEAEK